VDVTDASGTRDSDVNFAEGVNLHKLRLGPGGGRLREYATPQTQRFSRGAGGGGVLTVDLDGAFQQLGAMEEEMAGHEGCRLVGDATVRRVAGRVRFSVHQGSIVDLLPQMLSGHMLPAVRNMSHVVRHVSFGPRFPGQVSPLDGAARIEPAGAPGSVVKYFLKVVGGGVGVVWVGVLWGGGGGAGRCWRRGQAGPAARGPARGPRPAARGPRPAARGPRPPPLTYPRSLALPSPPPLPRPIPPPCPQIVPTEYTTRLGTLLETNQYSVAEYAAPLGRAAAPAVEISWELSPIVMRIHQSPFTLAHFLVRLCAVVGGVASVTRLVDRWTDAAVRAAAGGGGGPRASGGGGLGASGGGGLLPTRSGGGLGSVNGSSGGGGGGGLGAPLLQARYSSGDGGGGSGSFGAPLARALPGSGGGGGGLGGASGFIGGAGGPGSLRSSGSGLGAPPPGAGGAAGGFSRLGGPDHSHRH
jgi:hypothetical protein